MEPGRRFELLTYALRIEWSRFLVSLLSIESFVFKE
jgi:hypothetical protein